MAVALQAEDYNQHQRSHKCRDGMKAGLFEGKELGLQKGWEIGQEVGFYAGCIQVCCSQCLHWGQVVEIIGGTSFCAPLVVPAVLEVSTLHSCVNVEILRNMSVQVWRQMQQRTPSVFPARAEKSLQTLQSLTESFPLADPKVRRRCLSSSCHSTYATFCIIPAQMCCLRHTRLQCVTDCRMNVCKA